MFWHNFAAWFKKRRLIDRLDHALVNKTRTSLLPRRSQYKYLFHFLSVTEKKVFFAALISLVSGLIGTLAIFLSHHLATLPKDGGTYIEAMVGEPKYINPIFAGANDVDSDLSSLIYAGLFHYSTAGNLEPYLAENFTISADKKTYTVTLRPNLVWSDGEPLTIADVIFTLESIQNPDVGSPLFSTFQGVVVEVAGENSVRFTLKEPFAPFTQSLAIGILPEHLWGDVAPANLRLAKTNLQPVGAGPWKFSKLIKNEAGQINEFALERNEKFFGQKPYLTKISFIFFSEYREALDALKSQNIDGLSFIPLGLIDKLNARKFNATKLHLPQYTAIFFNQSNQPLLKNSEVREALTLAIDKNRVIAESLNGYGEPAHSPFAFTTSTGAEFSPDKANGLLDKKWLRAEPENYFKLKLEAGIAERAADKEAFKKTNSSTQALAEFDQKLTEELTKTIRASMDSSQTFYRRDKNNNLLSMTITTVDTPEYIKTAELIRAMWQKIGVQTSINTINSRQIIRDVLKEHHYDALIYGEIMGADPDPFPFWHSSQIDYPGLNVALYSSRQADKLLEEARRTPDLAKRQNLYRDFAKLLNQDQPAVFLFSPSHLMAIGKNIKGVTDQTINSPSDRYAALSNWYRRTKWQWK